MPVDYTKITVEIEKEFYIRLVEIKLEEGKDKKWVINKALEEYLTKEE